MNKIYYIGFFGDALAYNENRYIHPAGVNKMDYIARAISSGGLKVRILSPAWLKYKKEIGLTYCSGRKFSINENIDCVLPFSIALPFRATQLISMLISKIWLILYIFFNVRAKDKIVVYHSTFCLSTLFWLKKIIKFNLILEVEEVYSIVFSMSSRWNKKERRLIAAADSYIFPNDLMYDYLGIKHKKQVVVYGSYNVKEDKINPVQFGDGKIHLVYAGSIDKLRLAAHMAVDATHFLDHNYVLHILGFGKDSIIEDLLKKIELTNRQTTCKTIFEGVKRGAEYDVFMAKCQIGLNTQQLGNDYMKLAFPSKVLSYLSLGLNVVSRRIGTIEESNVADIVSFYNEDSAESIAHAIKQVKVIDSKTIKNTISDLNLKFKKEVHELLCD